MTLKNSTLARTAVSALLVAGGIVHLAIVPAAAQSLPQAIQNNVRIDQRLDAQVPLNTTFTDDSGKKITLRECIHNRPTILVTPFYRCAGMCTLELDGMAKTFNAMQFTAGKEFSVVALSIDPRENYLLAQEKKRDYLDLYNRPEAKAGWHFLTGDATSIHQVTDAVGFRYIVDPKTQTPIHAVGIMVLTPEGRVSRYFLGVDYSPRDMRLALVDASQNRIGSLSDKFTLLCSHFDPSTSKYGVAIDRIIKFSCTLTVLILATFITAMFRFEKRRAAEQQNVLDGHNAGVS